jgi:phage terminase large subunit GpA-like protein
VTEPPLHEQARAVFAEHERRAWAPPEDLTVSEWADRHRVVSARKGNPEPGPWRTSRTPYLREIMDAAGDPDVEFIAVVKPAQVGGSEGAIRNPLGYWIDQDPGA